MWIETNFIYYLDLAVGYKLTITKYSHGLEAYVSPRKSFGKLCVKWFDLSEVEAAKHYLETLPLETVLAEEKKG